VSATGTTEEDEFTPPGDGWIVGLYPEAEGYETVRYSAPGQRTRWWSRKTMPTLPTEPGTVICYTDSYGEGMAFLHPDGKWYSGEAGHFTAKGLRALRSFEVVSRPAHNVRVCRDERTDING
jgi:hypothetical protein